MKLEHSLEFRKFDLRLSYELSRSKLTSYTQFWSLPSNVTYNQHNASPPLPPLAEKNKRAYKNIFK